MNRKTKRKPKAETAAAAPTLPSFPDRVVPECVTLAKNLLADCEAGRFKAVAIAFVNQTDQTGSASALPPNNPTQIHLLCAAISKLDWAFNKALVG